MYSLLFFSGRLDDTVDFLLTVEKWRLLMLSLLQAIRNLHGAVDDLSMRWWRSGFHEFFAPDALNDFLELSCWRPYPCGAPAHDLEESSEYSQRFFEEFQSARNPTLMAPPLTLHQQVPFRKFTVHLRFAISSFGLDEIKVVWGGACENTTTNFFMCAFYKVRKMKMALMVALILRRFQTWHLW